MFNNQRLKIIIITTIFVFILYLLYVFAPTTIGNVISKYIDTEEIVKITFIVDETEKDIVSYHIPDKEAISSLHDYFYNISAIRVPGIPSLKENDNFIFYIYDKSGNIVRITSHDGYNGLYLYVQSKKWYKVKNYNNSIDIINDVKKMLTCVPLTSGGSMGE